MRFPLIFALILLCVNGLVDFAVYRSIVKSWGKGFAAKLQKYSALILAAFVVVLICLPKRSGTDDQLVFIMWALYAYLSIYIPKYLALVFYLMSRIMRMLHVSASRCVYATGWVIGAIVFLSMWWGALINRYTIQVKDVSVQITSLPKAFDGFKIAQVSDLHVGTFGKDTAFVSKLVERVNSLNPDLIVFTGDIVNRHSVELKPFITTLARFKAPYGVYSVMGNHDYGDYSEWPSQEAKDADVLALKSMQESMGWHMLNNATAWVKAGADSIALIGVENIGDPPFKVYGDLHKAYANLSDKNVKILLSHNPAHWEAAIENNPKANIALTLSGHTHAMQIEIFGWSPASWRYKKWGGLYTDANGHNLYVNIGAGTVGMPYRIGASPEITLFTLTPAKN